MRRRTPTISKSGFSRANVSQKFSLLELLWVRLSQSKAVFEREWSTVSKGEPELARTNLRTKLHQKLSDVLFHVGRMPTPFSEEFSLYGKARKNPDPNSSVVSCHHQSRMITHTTKARPYPSSLSPNTVHSSLIKRPTVLLSPHKTKVPTTLTKAPLYHEQSNIER